MKKCNMCKLEKDFNCFSKCKNNNDGYKYHCKECGNLMSKKYYEDNKEKTYIRNKKWIDNNKEKDKKTKKEYYKNNIEKCSLLSKNYNLINKEKIKIQKANYYLDNRENILKRNYKYYSTKLNADDLFKLKCNLRNLIKNSLHKRGLNKKNKTEVILGCSFEDFKLYLESKFEAWMNWENRGLYNGEINYGWDIDHIIPLSSAKSEDDLIKLNHYTNLQPLCSKTNRDIKK